MKQALEQLLGAARDALAADGRIPAGAGEIEVQRTRDTSHGDFSCNLAMTLAAAAKRKPRELAAMIVESLPASPLIERVEIAGPGFINFFLKRDAWFSVVPDVLQRGTSYGHGEAGTGEKILLEFVSANPTGPLHIGHGRGAAYGALWEGRIPLSFRR